MRAGPLTLAPRAVLVAQSVLAVGFSAVVLLASGRSHGWADLVRAVAVLLGGVYLLGVAIAWALARFAVAQTAARVVLAVAVPPAVLACALALLRAR